MSSLFHLWKFAKGNPATALVAAGTAADVGCTVAGYWGFKRLRKSEESRRFLHDKCPWLLNRYYALENWLADRTGQPQQQHKSGDRIRLNDARKWQLLEANTLLDEVEASNRKAAEESSSSGTKTTEAGNNGRKENSGGEKRPRLER